MDFKYNHYLIDQNGNRVGYRFYWADFASYPVFNNPDDIPVVELPVRMEHWTIEEILLSFIEAISQYYIWLMNRDVADYIFDENDAEEVLEAYLNDCSIGTGVGP